MIEKIKTFIKNNYILLIIFLIISTLIIFASYINNHFLSPDASNYLLEANALIKGHGFNQYGEAGMFKYFATWPIGYPFAIAFVSFTSRVSDLYLASKIVAILIIFLICYLFGKHFGKKSWIFSLPFFTYGFLLIFYTPWSETLYILGMICFGFSMLEIVKKEQPTKLNYVLLFLSILMCFLSKYVGLCVLGVVGIYFLICLFNFRKSKNKILLRKIRNLFFVAITILAIVFIYLFINKQMAGHATGMERIVPPETFRQLLKMLYYALIGEAKNMSILPNFTNDIVYIIFGFLPMLYLCYYFIKERKKRNDNYNLSLIFFGIGTVSLISIVFMRFVSHFDNLGYRLLFPSTFMFYISFATAIIEFMQKNKRRNMVISIIFAAIIVSLATNNIFVNENIKITKNDGTSYKEGKERFSNLYSEIEPGSILIWANLSYKFLRPDIAEISPEFAPYYKIETLSEFRKRIDEQKKVYIDTSFARSSLNRLYIYDKNLVIYFKEYLKTDKKIISIDMMNN